MQPIRPMLGDLELQQVQCIEVDGDQVLTRHDVPALEGDFFQRLGRRGALVTLTGVLTGPEARESLADLRTRFRNAEPILFTADLAAATSLADVLIEDMQVAERAGHPDCFEYGFRLREFTPPEPIDPEKPKQPPPPVRPIEEDTGTLIVNVEVEGEPAFDFSTVTVTASGAADDGTVLNRRPLTNREDNRWTEEKFPAGSFNVEAAVPDENMSETAPAVVRPGATTEITIALRRGVPVAEFFLIHYRFDSAFVEPCMRAVLSQVAQHAADNASKKFLVVGETDLVGSIAYNQSLSERRARGAFAFLRFGNDADGSVAEWDQLRRSSGSGLNDRWGAREYQQMLQDLGFYNREIHGRHDGPTDDAVKEFQRQNGLTDDGDVGNATWPVLIRAYLAQDDLSIPDDRFLPNCPDEILRWLGCSELDPVKETEKAWRPNRRTEFLFVDDDSLPADVARPDTFALPVPGGIGGGWCLNDSGTTTRCCFVVPHLVQQSTDPDARGKEQCDAALVRGPAWRRQLAEPQPAFVVKLSIKFEDDTPLANTDFVLIASDGEFMTGEVPKTSGSVRAGTGKTEKTDANGEFTFDRPASPPPPATPTRPADAQKTPGIFVVEIKADVVARAKGQPLEEAEGPVVCKRLAGPGEVFEVIVVGRAAAGVHPALTAPDAVVMRKPHTNPARQPVQLSVDVAFNGTGTFTVEAGQTRVRLFDAPAAGNQLAFDGTDNVFTSDQLVAGVTLFIEGGPDPSAAVDDVELRLLLTVGGQPGFADREQLTSVRLTLDIAEDRLLQFIDPPVLSEADKANPGRLLQVQNARFDARRALTVVRRAEPNSFTGNLEINGFNGGVRLFGPAQEQAAAGQLPRILPDAFANATVPVTGPPLLETGLRFFAEGARVSLAARDTVLQLGLAGIEPDGDRVAFTIVQSDFINQANIVFPITVDDACMMVSNFVTNVNLPNNASFNGPPGANPDPDTFRLQLTGLPGGQSPQVRLQTFRGAVQQSDHTFDMVEGVIAGRPAYRINEHVRLVSNTIDDGHRLHQTVLVRLEDTVRATTLLDGSEIARVELPVGRPPAETGTKAVRTCDIHFVTLSGTNSDPARTIARMSEDWAQLAIRFNLLSCEVVTTVLNVLTVIGTATASQKITFDMTNAAGTTASVAVDISSGDNKQAIANKIAAQISAEADFNATTHRHHFQTTDLVIVLVNPRQNVDFENIVGFEAPVVVQAPGLDFTDNINALEGNVLGLNFDDGNDSSIDMIAIGRVGIQLASGGTIARAATGNDSAATNLPGWQNLCIIQEQAVDTDDADLPFTAGHEMGHALMDGGNAIHHPQTTNLFRGGGTSTTDTFGASKRLDDDQNTQARARSGPTTVPPLLLQR